MERLFKDMREDRYVRGSQIPGKSGFTDFCSRGKDLKTTQSAVQLQGNDCGKKMQVEDEGEKESRSSLQLAKERFTGP